MRGRHRHRGADPKDPSRDERLAISTGLGFLSERKEFPNMRTFDRMTRTVTWICDGCGIELERQEPGDIRRPGRPPRWCSDACRMRAARAGSAPEKKT